MPMPFSKQHITPEQFDRLFLWLSERYKTDLFRSKKELIGGGESYICLEPYRELIIEEETTRSEMAEFCFSSPDQTFGYLSYDYGRLIGGIKTRKTTTFPLGHLKKYSALFIFDGKLLRFEVNKSDFEMPKIDVSQLKYSYGNRTIVARDLAIQSLSEAKYKSLTAHVINYIREGYIYQLNLTIKYTRKVHSLNANELIIYLWRHYPASHYTLFHTPNFQILSTSPESFLSVNDGNVLSRPIKGTLAFDTYEPELRGKLTGSPKESAELSMIVDMVRNDISKNCSYGSVDVKNHKSVFVVDNLLQMYSDVVGRLGKEKSVLDLLLDAFPGASITGCPKKKAMELIDELEPHSRDIYCGSFFVIKNKKNMESSIAIRTGYYDKISKVFSFYAGSGIIVESEPDKEYWEAMAKAGKFLRL